MKINYLSVSKYKNLENLKLRFDGSRINLLVGQNGLGKSNLIEIIVTIFKDLDLAESEEKLLELYRKENRFDYSIIYRIDDITVRIQLRDNKFNVGITHFRKPVGSISFNDFKRSKGYILPNRIIGYYSGENKRLQESISDYKEIEKRAQIRMSSIALSNRQFRRIFFAENYHSSLILFVLYVYSDNNTINDFLHYISINGVYELNALLKNPSGARYKRLSAQNKTVSDYRDRLFNGEEDSVEFNFWDLKGDVDKLITILFDYAYNHNTYNIYDKQTKAGNATGEYVELDAINVDDLKGKLRDEFPTPMELFDALESCYVIGVFEKFEISIMKTECTSPILYKGLSEGEQQLISSLGILLLSASEKNILYLFDEPDTHINPKWQREYMELLSKIESIDKRKQLFISTHSPLLVQANNKDINVLLFKKIAGGIKIDPKDYSIPNWKIGQVLMSEYFDLHSTRPTSIDELMNLRTSLIEKGELTVEEEALLKEYENELGFLPTGETISEIKSMAYIFDVARKLQEREEGEK